MRSLFFCNRSQLLSISIGVRRFAHSSLDDKHSCFTLSFLVNSCGYPLQTARSILEKVQLKHPKRPDDALRLFYRLHKNLRDHKMMLYKKWGWSEDDLDFVLKNHPTVLRFSDEMISNTMDFFVNKMGYKSVDIARCPSIMRYSLENRIMPRCYVYQALSLKDLLQKEVGLRVLLKYSPVEFEEKFVVGFIKDDPRLLDLYHGKITLLELGFTSEDVKGVKPPPFFNLCKSNREKKIEIYKSWGLSENELEFASKYHPRILLHQDEKITNTMDFLVNKMGYKSLDVLKNPSNLQYCLETRIIPRCLVYKVLLLKGLLTNEINLTTLLCFHTDKFEERFVTRYMKDVPQIWNVYQGKIGLLELGFTSEDVKGVKPPPRFTLSDSTLERRMKIYKSWGLSENELDLALKIWPTILHYSDEKILNTMEFLVNKMGYKSVDIVRPNMLNYSLETRIIPRCLVYKVLLLKGLLTHEIGLISLLGYSLNYFEERFVRRYEKVFPQLLNVYQGEITLVELGYTSEDVKGVKPKSLINFCKPNPEDKMKLYRSWGVSESELDLASKHYPRILLHHDEKISKTMDFLVNQMGYKAIDAVRNLQYCLETRIIPRCLVVKVLLLKGLLSNEISLSTLLLYQTKKFEERFVTKYKKHFPRISYVYQGKMSLLELGFTSEDVKGVKPPSCFTLTKSNLEHKMKIYKRWGLSENEFYFAAKTYPCVLHYSDEKISNTMNFIVNKIGFKPVDIVRPCILRSGLETRIIPRCLVYKVLVIKGLLKNEFSLSTLLRYSSKDFEERFVRRYRKDVPQLLNFYQGKITLSEALEKMHQW